MAGQLNSGEGEERERESGKSFFLPFYSRLYFCGPNRDVRQSSRTREKMTPIRRRPNGKKIHYIRNSFVEESSAPNCPSETSANGMTFFRTHECDDEEEERDGRTLSFSPFLSRRSREKKSHLLVSFMAL